MATSYFGENGKNMHCRSREHISKFNSKSKKLHNESAFLKHLESSNGGRDKAKHLSDFFDITILKAYRKPFTKCVEEGTYIANHNGELLNSKSEWHQAKIIRTTTAVIQGGADILQQGKRQAAGSGEQGGGQQGRGRTPGVGEQDDVQGGRRAGVQQPLEQRRRRSPRGH